MTNKKSTAKEDKLTKAINQRCEICLHESKHYDGSLLQKPKHTHDDYSISKELIQCQECKKFFHGACVKANASEITFKDFTSKGNKKFEFYMPQFICVFCKTKEEKVCVICQNPDFINASVSTGEGESSPCHLICALLSPRFKMKNFDNFEFEVEKNAEISDVVSNCLYCTNEIEMGGISCNHKGCKKSAHLRCALKNRSSILNKHRPSVMSYTSLTGLSYNTFENIWHVSYGLFSRKGESLRELKIDESLLMNVKPYATIMNEKIDKSLLDQFKLGIITELNYDSDQMMIHEKNFVDEISINFSVACDEHKYNQPHYCYCGVNEEIVEIEKSGSKDYDSVFCNDCGIWFHKDCLPESEKALDYYECPKCVRIRALDNSIDNFHTHQRRMIYHYQNSKANNFVLERNQHILKRDNVQIIDYLLVLKSLIKHNSKLKTEEIKFWQQEVPFSLEIVEKKHLQNVKIIRVVKEHMLFLFSNLYKSHFEKFTRGIDRIEQIDFAKFHKEYLSLKMILNEIKIHFKGQFDDFYSNVETIGQIFQKLESRELRFDELSMLVSLCSKYNMVKDTNLEKLLENLEKEMSAILQVITKNLKKFMQIFDTIDIFSLQKSNFDNIPTFSSAYRLKEISKMSKDILDNMKSHFKKIKQASSCNSIQNLKENFMIGIKSLFFTDLETYPLIKEYVDYYKNAIDWKARHRIYQQGIAEQIKVTKGNFYLDPNAKDKILKKESIEQLLKFNSKYKGLLESQDLIRLRKAEQHATAKAKDYKDLLQNYCQKGIALNDHNYRMFEEYYTLEQTKALVSGELKISEQDFEVIFELFKTEKIKEPTLLKELKCIMDLKERINCEDFVKIVPKDQLYQHILDTYESFYYYGIEGKALDKLENLKKPIVWVDNLRQAYFEEGNLDGDTTRNDFIQNFQTKYINFMSDSILQKYIFTQADTTTSDLTKKFRPFPELKQMVLGSIKKYYEKLLDNFKSGSQISVILALKLNNLKYVLNLSDIKDPLFDRRYDHIKQLVCQINKFVNKDRVSLKEYLSEVNEMFNKGTKLTSFPKFESSYIKASAQWLNQARIVAQVLKSISQFDGQDDVVKESIRKYTKIYELVNSNSFHKVNIATEDINNPKMMKFIDTMSNIIDLQTQWEKVLFTHTQMVKNISSSNLNKKISARIDEVLKLTDIEQVDKLYDQMEGIIYFDSALDKIDDYKEELDKFKSHMVQLFEISKLLKFEKNVSANFTEQNLAEFQIYVNQFLFERVKKLRFCDEETRDYLKIIKISVFGINLYVKQGQTIEQLKEGLKYFKEQKQTICQKMDLIDRLNIDVILEQTIKSAEYLKNKFYNSQGVSIEEFFETFESVTECKVKIIEDIGQGSRFSQQVETYKKIIFDMKKCWERDLPLSQSVTIEDFHQAQQFVMPLELITWAETQLSENRLEGLWIGELCNQKNVHGYEVELCLNLSNKDAKENADKLKKLKNKYEHSNDIYTDIETLKDLLLAGKRSTSLIEEIFTKIQKIEVEFLDRNLLCLIEILNYLLEKDEQKIDDLYHVVEIFTRIQSLIEKGSEDTIISQIGAIKFEIKDDFIEFDNDDNFMKEETDIVNKKQKKKNYSKIIDFFKYKVFNVYKQVSKIKSAIMDTVGEFLQKDSEEKNFKNIKSRIFSKLAIRTNKELQGLDFDIIVEQVKNYVLNENNPLTYVNIGDTSYFENENFTSDEQNEFKSPTKKRLRKMTFEMLKTSINTETHSLVNNLKKKIVSKLKLKKHFKNPKFEKKNKIMSAATRASRRSSAKKGSAQKREGPGFDFNRALEAKICKVLEERFNEIRLKDLDKIKGILVQELSKQMAIYKLEDFMRTMETLDLRKKGQKQIFNAIVSKIESPDFQGIMPILMNLDMSFLIAEDLVKTDIKNQSRFLTKRFPEDKLLNSSDPKLTRNDFNLGKLQFLSITCKEDGNKKQVLGEFTTKLKSDILEKVRVPEGKTQISVYPADRVPSWVEVILKNSPTDECLLGIIQCQREFIGQNIKYLSSRSELGEVEVFFAKGKSFLGGIMESFGYRGDKYENSIFFVINLSELALKNKRQGWIKLEFGSQRKLELQNNSRLDVRRVVKGTVLLDKFNKEDNSFKQFNLQISSK